MRKTHITANINGDSKEFLCDPRETLLDVLRDNLALTGAKEGCGTGDCGACSVIFEGKVVCSCLVLAVEAEGKTIETVEGGGMIILLLRTMDSLKQLYSMTMDVHSRFRTGAYGDVVPRFNERFIFYFRINNRWRNYFK